MDQPVTGIFTALASNPPFALPLSFVFKSPTAFTSLPALFSGSPSSIAPTFVDPNFHDANVHSWNLNVQQELTRTTSMMAGYFANKGTHLEDDINANQTTSFGNLTTALPLQRLSPNSPFLPNAALAASITKRSTGSNSIYNSLWVTATQKTSHNLQFNVSYTYSHAIDDVSRNAGGIFFANSNDIFLNRASSDFDARHRFVANAIYDLPGNRNNRLLGGWELAPIVVLQSGNPFSIVENNSAQINGVAASNVTPNVSAPLQVTGNPLGQWIANPGVLSFTGLNSIGNLGRNAVIGPSFMNFDFALVKNTKLTEKWSLQLRIDAFDLFNHPNYAQPGPQSSPSTYDPAVLTPGNQFSTFSTITGTRFPTGDFGSSRQLQLAAKITF
jgi:hypothetical protein